MTSRNKQGGPAVADRWTTARYESVGLLTRERLGYSLPFAAARFPNRPFLLFEDRWLSYRDVALWSGHVATDLLARGVQPGHRVLVQAPNRPEVAVLQLAAWRIGAVAVPVISALRAHELRHILGDSRPVVLASMTTLGSRQPCAELDAVAADCGLEPVLRYALDAGPAEAGWRRLPMPDERTAMPDMDDLREPREPGECHLILYTSGTTSAPKGAMLTGAGILSSCSSVQRTIGLSERDVFVAGSPIAHVAGMVMGVLLPMMLGARSIILGSWDADAAVELIEREHATFMSSAPVFLSDLVSRYEAGEGARHRLSVFMAGGAAMSPRLIERADAVGVRASRVYGMTETSGACAMTRPDDPLERRATTDGRVAFGTEIEVVDDARAPLPAGEMGEVRLRSPQLMTAYTDAEATGRQIDEDGWFYPGDVGRVDSAGWFTMVGRTKDIINRGGEKFSAQDIEQALSGHPDIAVAAVVGAPDKRLGEVVAAFLELIPGARWDGPEEVRAHLEQIGLAKAKMPVHWRVLNQMPRTSTGKIRKQNLVSLLAREPADQDGQGGTGSESTSRVVLPDQVGPELGCTPFSDARSTAFRDVN